MSIEARSALFAAMLMLAGCVSHPADTQAYLSGLQQSPEYRRGYADGCETANLASEHAAARRDNDAFQNNPDYRLGWAAGQEKCKPVTFARPGPKSPY